MKPFGNYLTMCDRAAEMSGRSLRLSILDQSPVPEGKTHGQALRNSVALAKAAEAFGYHRYWVAEHHALSGHACIAPEILVAAIAGETRRMRVGSGAVLLTHYSAFKVAEVFAALACLFPQRIDLGVARAAGTRPETVHALQRDRRRRRKDDFPEQLSELADIVQGRVPPQLSAESVANLVRCDMPELWLLGSSPYSAGLAASLGLPYAYADFCWSSRASAMEAYAAGDDKAPPAIVAISVTGSPRRVRDAIETAARDYGVGEVMILIEAADHAARVRAYERIAREFGLQT
jgi:luciferase family oxidoreductase group 1